MENIRDAASSVARALEALSDEAYGLSRELEQVAESTEADLAALEDALRAVLSLERAVQSTVYDLRTAISAANTALEDLCEDDSDPFGDDAGNACNDTDEMLPPDFLKMQLE